AAPVRPLPRALPYRERRAVQRDSGRRRLSLRLVPLLLDAYSVEGDDATEDEAPNATFERARVDEGGPPESNGRWKDGKEFAGLYFVGRGALVQALGSLHGMTATTADIRESLERKGDARQEKISGSQAF